MINKTKKGEKMKKTILETVVIGTFGLLISTPAMAGGGPSELMGTYTECQATSDTSIVESIWNKQGQQIVCFRNGYRCSRNKNYNTYIRRDDYLIAGIYPDFEIKIEWKKNVVNGIYKGVEFQETMVCETKKL